MTGQEERLHEVEQETITPPSNGERKTNTDAGKGRTRKWTDTEVDQLLELLEKNVCLWDVASKDYHVRNKRERALDEMSETLDIPVGDIRAKIVSIRAQLGREITKMKGKK